jgi:hypothetical protein
MGITADASLNTNSPDVDISSSFTPEQAIPLHLATIRELWCHLR